MESPSTGICLSCSSHFSVHKGHMNSEEPLYSLQDSVPAACLGMQTWVRFHGRVYWYLWCVVEDSSQVAGSKMSS